MNTASRMCERGGTKGAERARTSVERGAVAVSRHGVELVLVIRPPLSRAYDFIKSIKVFAVVTRYGVVFRFRESCELRAPRTSVSDRPLQCSVCGRFAVSSVTSCRVAPVRPGRRTRPERMQR